MDRHAPWHSGQLTGSAGKKALEPGPQPWMSTCTCEWGAAPRTSWRHNRARYSTLTTMQLGAVRCVCAIVTSGKPEKAAGQHMAPAASFRGQQRRERRRNRRRCSTPWLSPWCPWARPASVASNASCRWSPHASAPAPRCSGAARPLTRLGAPAAAVTSSCVTCAAINTRQRPAPRFNRPPAAARHAQRRTWISAHGSTQGQYMQLPVQNLSCIRWRARSSLCEHTRSPAPPPSCQPSGAHCTAPSRAFYSSEISADGAPN